MNTFIKAHCIIFFFFSKALGERFGKREKKKSCCLLQIHVQKTSVVKRTLLLHFSLSSSKQQQRKKEEEKKEPKSCFGSKPTQPNPPFPISPLPTYIPTYASCMFYVCVASQIASSMSVCLSALPKLNRPSWKKKIDPSSKRPSISSNVIWQGDIAKSKLAPSCQLEKRRERGKKAGFKHSVIASTWELTIANNQNKCEGRIKKQTERKYVG